MKITVHFLTLLVAFARDCETCKSTKDKGIKKVHEVEDWTLDKMQWLKEEEHGIVLTEHKKIRDLANGEVVNMEELTWSDNLKNTVTKTHEVKCDRVQSAPKTKRLDVPGFGWITRIIYTNLFHKPDPAAVIRHWAQTKSAYKSSSGRCKKDADCRPYKQMMWPSTNQIACGNVKCADTTKEITPNVFFWNFFVCFYAPAYGKV